jgi:hypothetical protein
MNETSETEIPAKGPFAQLPSRPKSLSVNKKLKRDNSILSAQNVFRLAFCLTPHDIDEKECVAEICGGGREPTGEWRKPAACVAQG